MLQVVTTIQDLNGRGIAFRSLTENIDTTNAAGRFMLHVFASLAELERDVTVERIKATLGAKKRRGEKIGERYFRLSRQQVEDAKALLAGGRSQIDTAKTIGVILRRLRAPAKTPLLFIRTVCIRKCLAKVIEVPINGKCVDSELR
jgi:DNA invertase Pin-like site-specific DNA recombinase